MSEFVRCLIVAGVGTLIGIKIGRDRETDRCYRAMAETFAEHKDEINKEEKGDKADD